MTETREGTDVVERLTFTTRPVGDITLLDFRSGGCRPASDVEIECLAEITRLRAENERLREALEQIIARSENGELGTSKVLDMAAIARAALSKALGEGQEDNG